MATNFSPVLGVLCFKPIPKYCNVWYEGILLISLWSNTGLSWPLVTCLQYKTFENTVEKGEIARNGQFLLFPKVFSTFLEDFPAFSSNLKLSSACRLSVWKTLKFVIWERIK